MEKNPEQEWLKKYNEKKQLLTSPVDFNQYFTEKEMCGKKLFHLEMGNVSFPTGNVIVCDPLVYISRKIKPYFVQTPTGTFPLTTLVAEVEKDYYRYVAVQVKFTDNKAVNYIEALKGTEDLDGLEEGEYFGFNVDAGLATVIDTATRDAYCDFEDEWRKENTDGNVYDDFFADEFKKSYEQNPQFQRKGGDWINFNIPNTNLNIPMIQSGFGDGSYPVYFGYDADNKICELVIQFIDIELAFGEKEE